MQETSGKARYFAFISHKSTDTKFALKMHRFIESYNLPTAVRKMTPAPKRLTPLCSYEIDFSANPLLDEMREKLRQSQYLILICSESLVKSGTKFVNYEIETFMQCRREEGVDPLRRIIPIIVSGVFDSPEHECCPEALKALGDNRPIAVDRQKCKNDREVFLRAISGMLDIDFAVLENRDHKRQSVRRMIAAGAAALALAAGICLGEYFIPRQYHYADFVMQNGVPVGIERLSRREYEGTASHYVITVQKHRVTSLRHVNAQGSTVLPPEDPITGGRPAAYTFQYSGSALSAVTYYDQSGRPYFILQYSGGLSAADLKDPADPARAYYAGSGFTSNPRNLLADYNLMAHSDISRFAFTYDENGYVTEILFYADTSGRMAGDSGVYGLEFVLDEQGRRVETYFLDALGNRRLNAEGVYCKRCAYDAENNRISLENLSAGGVPIADSDGVITMKSAYDDRHNLITTEFFDADGQPAMAEAYGAARQVKEVDEYGQTVRIMLYGPDGAPAAAADYCGAAFTYDENGFTASRTYLNAELQPILSADVHYAAVRYENDDCGNPLVISFWDADGAPVNNAYGYAKETASYNEWGQKTREAYFDSNGRAADYRGYGYSQKETDYDAFGREISVRYYDGDHNPVNTVGPDFLYGYHEEATSYDFGAYTMITVTFNGTDGKPVNSMSTALGETYARTVVCIQNGEITSSEQYDAEGNLWGEILEAETETNARAERIHTTRRYSSDRQLLQKDVLTDNIRGVPMKKVSTVFEDGKIAGELTVLYHETGRMQSQHYEEYAADGETLFATEQTYDEAERLSAAVSTDYTDAENRTSEYAYEYHENGTCAGVKITVSKADGTVTVTDETSYGTDGVRTAKKSVYYLEDGMKAVRDYAFRADGSYTVTTAYYTEYGTAIGTTEASYDSEGNPIV